MNRTTGLAALPATAGCRRAAALMLAAAALGIAPAQAQLVVRGAAAVTAADDGESQADPSLRAARQAIRGALAANPFQLPPDLAQRVAGGDTTPLVIAGIESLRGTHAPRNMVLALRLLQQAAAQADARALAALAAAQANGWGMPRDVGRAREQLLALQRIGFGRAFCMQAELDGRLPGGQELARNKALIAEGARRGDAYCQNLLGATLELDGDVEAAREAYGAAAAQGSDTAARNLARLAARSSGQRNSIVELTQQAEAGNPQAQFDLARRLHRGVGLPRDYAGALHWYREASYQLPQAREVLQLILQANGSADSLDPEVMQRLSNLPVIASVALPPLRRGPERDADALAGLDALPLQPWAGRLREQQAAAGAAPALSLAPATDKRD
jgi:TPR repeat protein